MSRKRAKRLKKRFKALKQVSPPILDLFKTNWPDVPLLPIDGKPFYKLVIGPIFPQGMFLTLEAYAVFEARIGPVMRLQHTSRNVALKDKPSRVSPMSLNEIELYLSHFELHN